MSEQDPGKSAEAPFSVRQASTVLGDYIHRLGRVWIEGEVIKPKQYGRTWYMTLRDTEAEVSMSLIVDDKYWLGHAVELKEGSKVVVLASIEWFAKRGELRLRAHALQPVGEGDLLARIEKLRRQLAAEGVFDAVHKQPLPFLPRKIGLNTGRDTDARKDILQNTWRRWPAQVFEIVEIPLTTKDTPQLAIDALARLERTEFVDVIIIARGGGSFEELLPWSDERLVRAVAKCAVPVISAIGHENDRPILDDAADVRASTPTDAAAKVVPSLAEEEARTSRSAARLRDHRSQWLRNQERHLSLARNVLRASSPRALVEIQRARISQARTTLTGTIRQRLAQQQDRLGRRQASLSALSPFAVLARGYALATTADGKVIRRPADLAVDASFNLRLQEGAIVATRNPDKE